MNFFKDSPLHQTYDHRDNSQSTDIIYVDYEKTFDKFSNNFLLGQLEYYGVQGQILSLFIQKALSSESEMFRQHLVASRVIQGSVIGPLLIYNIYFDLVDLIEIKMKYFAGDVKICENPSS